QEATALRYGYASVPAMKFDVTKKIRNFCAAGGYLFAMCSGAETFDIALAANGMDVSESYSDDGDVDLNVQENLDFSKTFAFENFTLGSGRPLSAINTGRLSFYESIDDFFTLFEFSPKWAIVPSLLTQNHEFEIREFFGQT